MSTAAQLRTIPPSALYGTSDRIGTLGGRGYMHWAMVVGLLLLLLHQVLPAAFQETTFGIQTSSAGALTIRDFAAHLTYTKAFWTSGADYSVEDHVRITDQWAGTAVGRALPFGYSPTMLLLLGPLSVLPTVWAYTMWCVLSALAVVWVTNPKRTVCIAGALVLLSPLGLACLALGQTALLTSAGLICLMLRQLSRHAAGDRETWSWSLLPDILLLWALTAKPPLALVAGVAILGGRRWRIVTAAVALTVVTTLLLTPQLSADWCTNYIHLLTHYDLDTANPAYILGLRPDHMSNLRSLFYWSGAFNDSVGCRISSLLWLGSMVSLTGLALGNWIRLPVIWSLSTLAYLLFCPQVTSTEGLHLILIVAVIAATGRVTSWGWIAVTAVLAVAHLAPCGLLPVGAQRSSLIFGIQLVLVALVVSTQRLTCGGRHTAIDNPDQAAYLAPS